MFKSLYNCLPFKVNLLLLEINSNERIITNALVKLFYEEKVSLNKNLLWKICGKQIAFNLQKKTSTIYFPVKDKSGTLEYLYKLV